MKKLIALIIFLAVLLAALTTAWILHFQDKGPCIPEWECSSWGGCIKSAQARTCTDKNSCSRPETKPEVVRTCNILCFNGILDQDEEEIDCGGTCEACDIKRAPEKRQAIMINILIYTLLIAGSGTLGYYIYKKGKGDTTIKDEISQSMNRVKQGISSFRNGFQVNQAFNDPRLPQLQQYIQQCLNSGYGEQAIRNSLANSQWPNYLVDKAFENIENVYIGR